MLLYCGEFLPGALRQARVTEDEIRLAVRAAGAGSLDRVRTVVLEIDGTFSVVRSGEDGLGSDGLGERLGHESIA